MTLDQARAAVTKAEADDGAAEQALKEAQRSEATLREKIAEAAWTNASGEELDKLRMELATAEARTRFAQLDVRRAQEAVERAKVALGHVTTYKKFFGSVVEQAQRIATLDNEIAVIAAEARQRILAKLEQRQVAITAAHEALGHIPGNVRSAVNDGFTPVAPRIWTPTLDALASVSPQNHSAEAH